MSQEENGLIKYGALCLLVIQASAVALVTNYSRNLTGPKYSTTTAGVCVYVCMILISSLIS